MNWTLEVVPVPVTDLDRAKEFYAEKIGFKVDLDSEVAPGVRIIQLTPPGSRCSVVMMSGMPPGAEGEGGMVPGTLQGIQLCVTDIEAAHAQLVARGVEVSPVRHLGESGWADGKGGEWNSFLSFTDPDGNGWTVQEAPTELAER
ncbi:VOC family protein [Kitasatospora sp. NPDC001664]